MTAINNDGRVESPASTFETLPSLPEQKANQYKPSSSDEGGAQEAEQFSREATEASQRERLEASERAAREAAEREKASSPPPLRCVVPGLKGDSLHTARRILSEAHCRLGRVGKAKNTRGQLVVIKQSARPGAKLGNNATVSVVLASRPPAAKRH